MTRSVLPILTIVILGIPAAGRAGDVDFSRDILPVFAEHCFECHGHDEAHREADLRLDDRASAVGAAIVPGDPGASPLIERIAATDPDLRMPPGEGRGLSPREIELVAAWIAGGADYQRHWAFEPIADPEPPTLPAGQPDEQLGPIDRFVAAGLQSRGLGFAERATKQQLIRRAAFDLTGLPPAWEDVVAFVEDDSPDAFEKVIDRLLASPAYGQRWGRHWLDIARYADTHGGGAVGFTKFAFSYTYRDYVIEAFNADLPYDRFILQQLAADQLGLAENAKELAGLGFLTVGMQFRNRHDTIDDQIDVVSRGLLGLTVACARCHDHKFDPIPTKDYYSLYAALASSDSPEQLPVIGEPTPTDELTSYQSRLAQLETEYADMARDQAEVLRSRLRMQTGLYLRELARGVGEYDLGATKVLSYRTDDIRPAITERWRRYLEKMPADDAVFGPWVRLAGSEAEGFADRVEELVAALRAENGEPGKELYRVAAAAPRWNPRVLDALAAQQPSTMLEVADAYGALFAEVQQEWLQALLDASLEALPERTPIPDEDPAHLIVNSPVHQQLRRHLHGPGSPTQLDDAAAARLLNRPVHDNLRGRKGAMHALNVDSPGAPPRAKILAESVEAGPYYVFRRGNPLDRGPAVDARFLTSLGGSDDDRFPPGARRLALAEAIIDPANPLTRRVIVNWLWQRHFGQGLVRTPDDFGTRGDPPTHPELLDYLASRLLEDGWSLKSMHRRIMLTRVYQQGARERPAARNVDPENRLLWRMPRRRLELEAMRDAMLAVSGELDRRHGGRPFELLATPAVPRRSVYAFINRDIVAPLLSTFDGPNPNACTAKRPQTLAPQQTLFALNSTFIQDRAAAMAAGAPTDLSNGESIRAEIRALYRRAYSRDPDADELAAAADYLASDTHDAPQQAWQRLAHVLLAGNEFVFVD